MISTTTTTLFAGAALRLLQDAAGAAEEPAEEKKYCKMVGGAFGDFVQLSLAVVGIGGLIIKRFQEPHPRPWRIWSMDVGKQMLGSLYAHLLNMLLAMGLTSIAGGGDQCSWYFIQVGTRGVVHASTPPPPTYMDVLYMGGACTGSV